MESLQSESEAYFVELHEYPIEEVFARLKASEGLVREAIVGLVSQPEFPTSYDVAGGSKPSRSNTARCLRVTSRILGLCPSRV